MSLEITMLKTYIKKHKIPLDFYVYLYNFTFFKPKQHMYSAVYCDKCSHVVKITYPGMFSVEIETNPNMYILV